MKNENSIPKMFIQFLKFGSFTFGGGWSIIAQIQREYVEKRKLLSNQELLDLTSVGRSLPGVMVTNVAMLFGYRQAGVLGGLVCVAGMVIPPMLILMLVTAIYSIIQNNTWVIAAMVGVRAAVAPIVICAVAKLWKGGYTYPPCYAVTLLTLVLYSAFNISAPFLVLVGALCGLIISGYMEHKGGKR